MPEPLPGSDGRIPPIDPPPGCVNQLMWRLSRRLFTEHRRGPDGKCLNCRPFETYPCVVRQLGALGLANAMGQIHATADFPHHPTNRGNRW